MDIGYSAKKPKDLTKINSTDFRELLWWSYYLGMSPEKILALVQEFGNSVKDITERKNN